MTPPAPPEAGPDFDGAQLGDVRTGDAAGGNIYHGAQLEELRAFVREYLWYFDQQSELYREETRERIRAVQIELWLYRIIIAAGVVGYIVLMQ